MAIRRGEWRAFSRWTIKEIHFTAAFLKTMGLGQPEMTTGQTLAG
jgi:hypothetical protein